MTEPPDLYPDERVLWTGAPARMAVFEPEDRILVPLHLLLLGGFVWLLLNNIIVVAPAGLPFVVVPLVLLSYALVGRLIVRGLAVRGSTYTITNRRLIVQMRVFGRRREYVEYLRTLKPPMLREHSDGTGTIRFGTTTALAAVSASRQRPGFNLADPQVLHAVPQARQVRDIIATAQSEAATR